MPELAEVFNYAKQWAPAAGKSVKSIELHSRTRVFRNCDTEQLEESLPGKKLKHCHTHGKQMLFEFTSGIWLGLHMGMTGSLELQHGPYEAKKHDHLVLHMSGDLALVFIDPRQFGAVRLGEENGGLPDWWGDLPPQPTDRRFTLRYLTDLLKRHGRQPIKALLLDQSCFPGVGNWMADEILWQIHVNPGELPARLSPEKVKAIYKSVRKVSTIALKTVGKNWSDPPAKWLFHQRWSSGTTCPRCGAKLRKAELRGRTACWCPECQPARE